MSMVCASKTLCCAVGVAVVLFCSTPRLTRATEPNNPRPGEVVRFDARNALTYIHHEPTDGDVTLQLKYTLDRTSQTWNLTISNNHLPISAAIFGIHYTDPRHFWLITHLGRRFAGAALLNLESRKIERGYAINGPYDISPDGFKLAYVFPNGEHDRGRAVFVNKLCIYPAVKLLSKHDDPEHYFDVEENVPEPPGVISEIQRYFAWQNEDTFQFIAKEIPAGAGVATHSEGQFIEYTVTGLSKAFAKSPPNAQNITVQKKELQPEEARAKIKKPYENHYHIKYKHEKDIKP